MAVEVRPAAWLVPIRPSCVVDSLPATAADLRGGQGIDLQRGQRLHLGAGRPADLRGGQGGDVLGGDRLQIRGADGVQCGGDTPVMPPVDSATIWVVLMLLPRALTCAEVNTLRAWVLRLERFVVATA